MLPVILRCHGFFVSLQRILFSRTAALRRIVRKCRTLRAISKSPQIRIRKMKKLAKLAMAVLTMAFVLGSCNKYETYADQKKRENSAINAYISDHNVKVITEEQFAAQNYTTDVAQNEFVLFDSNGIYLQIMRKGCGEPLKNGETSDVLVRFDEYNLLYEDSLQLSNNTLYFSSVVEQMTVTNTLGTFSGSFSTNSLMFQAYNSQSVPSGWLFPLTYINLGRPINDDDEIAKVRVIVPSSQGQSAASQRVYPCLYDLTYERGN